MRGHDNRKLQKERKKNRCHDNFIHLVADSWVTLVCSVVLRLAGREPSPMATLLVFIIGLLPLSCHHSEHFFSRGIVFWDSSKSSAGWDYSALLHTATVSCWNAMHSHTAYCPLIYTLTFKISVWEGHCNLKNHLIKPFLCIFITT